MEGRCDGEMGRCTVDGGHMRWRILLVAWQAAEKLQINLNARLSLVHGQVTHNTEL